ncbi:hypothetical protein A9Q99_00195 [Gammaproteobacteria bacterium 45_16_T64]|nr:hypothetical protein A9Q99_00195 [Gammaproteobacteria bacterium 45_16_T64]
MVLVDTAQAIGLAPTETLDSAQRVLVLKGSEEQTAGFLVDSIVKVTELSDWQSIGEDDQKHQSRFVDAISEYDNKGVSKLNLHKLVSCIDI